MAKTIEELRTIRDINARAAAPANAAAYADAYAAANAANAAARDKSLADFAECVVQILIEMKAPGCQWLDLTDAVSVPAAER